MEHEIDREIRDWEKTVVVYISRLTPVKILFRLRLQRLCPRHNPTYVSKGTDHGLMPKHKTIKEKSHGCWDNWYIKLYEDAGRSGGGWRTGWRKSRQPRQGW